jgi:hypothetical protein
MPNFESADHALIAGMVMGLAWKHGIDLQPVMNTDGYTPRYELKDDNLPEGVRVFINVEPPVTKKGVRSV